MGDDRFAVEERLQEQVTLEESFATMFGSTQLRRYDFIIRVKGTAMARGPLAGC